MALFHIEFLRYPFQWIYQDYSEVDPQSFSIISFHIFSRICTFLFPTSFVDIFPFCGSCYFSYENFDYERTMIRTQVSLSCAVICILTISLLNIHLLLVDLFLVIKNFATFLRYNRKFPLSQTWHYVYVPNSYSLFKYSHTPLIEFSFST